MEMKSDPPREACPTPRTPKVFAGDFNDRLSPLPLSLPGISD